MEWYLNGMVIDKDNKEKKATSVQKLEKFSEQMIRTPKLFSIKPNINS